MGSKLAFFKYSDENNSSFKRFLAIELFEPDYTPGKFLHTSYLKIVVELVLPVIFVQTLIG